MSKPIIDASNVSKAYRRGSIGGATLRDELARGWDRLRGRRVPPAQDFWALKAVSFDVAQGEVIGVIGRNGAGKSTLLKIVSRITQQTAGEITLRGRVASLLEIGTGFHPDLTGRENIFLNGAMLGMTKQEIRKKLDEIVAFAEIDEFIDTPVKRYSSGMYVRLAFAVAAHLDPEILIVDEVLAVGDVIFQQKCLGRMNNVAREGRTVVFVSHNMAVLAAICDSALVLREGKVAFRGPIKDGIAHYLSDPTERRCQVFYDLKPDAPIQFQSMTVRDARGRATGELSAAEPICISIDYEVTRPVSRVQIVCHVWTATRVHVLATADIDQQPALFERRGPGRYRADIVLPTSLLAPGTYELGIACGVPNQQLIDDQVGPTFTITALGSYAAHWSGARQDVIVALPIDWAVMPWRQHDADKQLIEPSNA